MGNITYDNNGLMTSNYNVKSCILYVSVYSNHLDFEWIQTHVHILNSVMWIYN